MRHVTSLTLYIVLDIKPVTSDFSNASYSTRYKDRELIETVENTRYEARELIYTPYFILDLRPVNSVILYIMRDMKPVNSSTLSIVLNMRPVNSSTFYIILD